MSVIWSNRLNRRVSKLMPGRLIHLLRSADPREAAVLPKPSYYYNHRLKFIILIHPNYIEHHLTDGI